MLEVTINEEFYELAYAALADYPFAGIEEKYDEINIFFNADDFDDNIKSAIETDLNAIDNSIKIKNISIINEKNWNEEWEKNVPAIKVTDRIGIAPSWKIDELDSEIKIIINPKMSFGTGEHSTTRLMLMLMEEAIKPGEFWVDAGTGTGVLAIAAIKLGARKVFAFDNNEWSVENSIENVALNKVSDVLDIKMVDAEQLNRIEADGVLANLNLNTIKNTLSVLSNILINKGNRLILSGVLLYDRDYIIDITESYGFKLTKELSHEEWIGLLFERI